jgi:hypothetical protein
MILNVDQAGAQYLVEIEQEGGMKADCVVFLPNCTNCDTVYAWLTRYDCM